MKPTSASDGYDSGSAAAYQISPNVHDAMAAVNATQAGRSAATRIAREATTTHASTISPM